MIRDSLIYQLRIYEIFDHNKHAFHERFRDHAARIMGRHDFMIVSMWEAKNEDTTEFVYLLQWPDETVMRRQWEAFMADKDWEKIKDATQAIHGPMVGRIGERIMRKVDYSPDLLAEVEE